MLLVARASWQLGGHSARVVFCSRSFSLSLVLLHPASSGAFGSRIKHRASHGVRGLVASCLLSLNASYSLFLAFVR